MSAGLLLAVSGCDGPSPTPMEVAVAEGQKRDADLRARKGRSEGKIVYVSASGTLLPTAPAQGRDKVAGWAVWHAREDCFNYVFCRQYYRYERATMIKGVPVDAAGRAYTTPTPCASCTG